MKWILIIYFLGTSSVIPTQYQQKETCIKAGNKAISEVTHIGLWEGKPAQYVGFEVDNPKPEFACFPIKDDNSPKPGQYHCSDSGVCGYFAGYNQDASVSVPLPNPAPEGMSTLELRHKNTLTEAECDDLIRDVELKREK